MIKLNINQSFFYNYVTCFGKHFHLIIQSEKNTFISFIHFKRKIDIQIDTHIFFSRTMVEK